MTDTERDKVLLNSRRYNANSFGRSVSPRVYCIRLCNVSSPINHRIQDLVRDLPLTSRTLEFAVGIVEAIDKSIDCAIELYPDL
jgi:hypothetical protein